MLSFWGCFERCRFGLVLFGFLLAAGVVLVHPRPSAAQDEEEAASDTTGWQHEVRGRFSASQAAYKDWQEGGLNSLSFTTALDGSATREDGRWLQSHSLRLVLGFIDQEERPIRKSEDLIRLNSSLQYQGEGFFRVFNPTIAGNLRSQFAAGFHYSDNPYPDGHPRADDEPPVQTSAFFSPAAITESVGLTYEPAEQLSIRFGVASKQTIVREPDFRVLYDVNQDEVVRVEAGAELASELDAYLSENIRYQSRLNVFLSVNQIENPPDVIWENVLTLEVNNWLSTDLEFVALYNENTTKALQLKEVLSVGVSFTLL